MRQNPEISLKTLKDRIKKLPLSKGLILSDFDETLCNKYAYDPFKKLHIPTLNPLLVGMAQQMSVPLLIATSRSGNESIVQTICSELTRGKDLPIVCENGASLYFPQTNLEVSLVDPEQKKHLVHIKKLLPGLNRHFIGLDLRAKQDRIATIEIRIQDQSGQGQPNAYAELVGLLERQVDPSITDIVSSNNSVSIQPAGINKRTGFQKALDVIGIKRSEVFVIGLGDAPNDKEIFESADFSIAVGVKARNMAQMYVPQGERVATMLFSLLQ